MFKIREMHKIINTAVIFMILVCWGGQEFAYSSDISCLRVPMGIDKNRAATGYSKDSSRFKTSHVASKGAVGSAGAGVAQALIHERINRNLEFQDDQEAVVSFATEQFGDERTIALAMLGDVLCNRNCWPVVERMRKRGLPIGVIHGLLHLPDVRFEDFPVDFQEFIIVNSACRNGFIMEDIENLWVLYTAIYPELKRGALPMNDALAAFNRAARVNISGLFEQFLAYRSTLGDNPSARKLKIRAASMVKNAKRQEMRLRPTFVRPDFVQEEPRMVELPSSSVLRGPLKQDQLLFQTLPMEGGFGQRFLVSLKDRDLVEKLRAVLDEEMGGVDREMELPLVLIDYEDFRDQGYVRIKVVQSFLRMSSRLSDDLKLRLGPLEAQALTAFMAFFKGQAKQLRLYIEDLFYVGHPNTREKINRLFQELEYVLTFNGRSAFWRIDVDVAQVKCGKRDVLFLPLSAGLATGMDAPAHYEAVRQSL